MTSVSIGSIIIHEGRRAIKEKTVLGLMDSIKEVGLLNAITVFEKGGSLVLVAGLHRLEACKRLGWETIPVQCLAPTDSDKARVDLAEVDENLIRNEIGALEMGEILERRKVIYEGLHPQTRKGGDPTSKAKLKKADLSFRFTKDTSATTGISETVIKQNVKIAKSLSKPTKEKIRNTPIADNKEELTALAKVPKNLQGKVVEQVLSGEKPSIRAAVEKPAGMTVRAPTVTAPPVTPAETAMKEKHTEQHPPVTRPPVTTDNEIPARGTTDPDRLALANKGAEMFLENISPVIKKSVIEYQKKNNNQCRRNWHVIELALKTFLQVK